MIVDAVPRTRIIISEVWRPLLALFIWDVIVTVAYYVLPFKAPSLPLTLFGTALALFLGFRTNSAYQRWWEGRQLWGLMINASRNIARSARNFLPDPEAHDMKRSIVLRQIAYVNALRCQLRKQPVDTEVLRFLSRGEAEPALARTNTANGLLDGTGRRIDDARRKGWIDTIQQTQMESVLVDIANSQGGMERLKNTPLPNQYRFIPAFFTRLFCVLLPIGLVETLGFATPVGSSIAGLMFLAALQIGDDLVDPFSDTVHDLPLSAMCRTIEIDLLQAIGDPAPEPMKPVDGVLW
ncbi:putative membrane protein [Sphingomonas sp. SORGH_AS 950]|uniref:bestrophin family protein n=1 Tax=unclassified Sphingomonas TaxID=196159 RepID=UPI00277F193E|nr:MULTISPECIES: bestrophin family ion channel [unclassified Sphingomonas]MDQ1157493.1 putative membrane protein [Sphingomonas sp. SORGH_AS_0950]MDR6114617.1 putative membrane protein [Sphingomonas sp. SORGH_AS_0789]MDR6147974.1 putative membrane protein [Sphingomonas sp. SORGH_AS_0870]MDR6151710.1 putative membrane protein [Sphingomonas sp. SORGH_AS_0742]